MRICPRLGVILKNLAPESRLIVADANPLGTGTSNGRILPSRRNGATSGRNPSKLRANAGRRS